LEITGKYFVVRSKSADNPFSEPDMLKIWKGLHYTMWHSDKLLVQQELAGTLSLLITAFTTLDSAVLFIKVSSRVRQMVNVCKVLLKPSML
jgi:hypothetical protein